MEARKLPTVFFTKQELGLIMKLCTATLVMLRLPEKRLYPEQEEEVEILKNKVEEMLLEE